MHAERALFTARKAWDAAVYGTGTWSDARASLAELERVATVKERDALTSREAYAWRDICAWAVSAGLSALGRDDRCAFVGEHVRADGYQGAEVVTWLVMTPRGETLEVHPGGWHRHG